MSNVKFGLGLLAAGLLAAGCAHKPTVVGTWNGSITQQGVPVTMTLTFTDDGKETVNASGTTPLGAMTMQGSGTYTATDTTLTQNIASFTVSLGGRSQTTKPGASRAETSTYKLDGDTLTITPARGGTAQTFTRAK